MHFPWPLSTGFTVKSVCHTVPQACDVISTEMRSHTIKISQRHQTTLRTTMGQHQSTLFICIASLCAHSHGRRLLQTENRMLLLLQLVENNQNSIYNLIRTCIGGPPKNYFSDVLMTKTQIRECACINIICVRFCVGRNAPNYNRIKAMRLGNYDHSLF